MKRSISCDKISNSPSNVRPRLENNTIVNYSGSENSGAVNPVISTLSASSSNNTAIIKYSDIVPKTLKRKLDNEGNLISGNNSIDSRINNNGCNNSSSSSMITYSDIVPKTLKKKLDNEGNLISENNSIDSSSNAVFDLNKVNLIPQITTSRKVIFTQVEAKILPLESAFVDRGLEYFIKYSNQHDGVASSFVAKSIGNLDGVYPEILRQVYFREDENSPVEVVSNIINVKNPAYWGVFSDVEGHLKSINLKYMADYCPSIQINTVKAYYYEDGFVHYVPMLTDSVITPMGKAWSLRPGRDFDLIDISPAEQAIRNYFIDEIGPRAFSDYSECLTSDYVSKNIGMIFFFLEGPASFSIFFRVLIVFLRIWIECKWYIKLKLFIFFEKYKICIIFFVLLFISFFIPVSGVYLLY